MRSRTSSPSCGGVRASTITKPVACGMTGTEMRGESVDLSALAESIAAELHKAEPERHAEFRITPGLTASGDPVLLRAVLENLLGNAWKFTAKRSDAIVEFGRTESDRGV